MSTMKEEEEVAPERAGEPGGLRHKIPHLEHKFGDETLLRTALISPASRSGGQELTFSRLANLGSGVLRFAVSGFLYHRFGDESEGDLHLRLETVVSMESRDKAARRLGLENFVLQGGANKVSDSAVADCYEALIAAVFLDGGWEAARDFTLLSLGEGLEQAPPRASHDAKTRLNNWCGSRHLIYPVYEALGQSGRDHNAVFHAAVRVEGPPKAKASASGLSRLKAENAAAEALLEQLPPPLAPIEAKVQMKSWCKARHLKHPVYEVLDPSGSADEPMFHVMGRMEVLPKVDARGSGSSPRKAMAAATEILLEQLLALSTIPWVLEGEVPHLGFEFSEPSLLHAALIPPIRRSVAESLTFKRLEFLGDQALALAVMVRLHHQFKDAGAGDLSFRLDALVSNENWHKVALRLGLERFVFYDGECPPSAFMPGHKALADCYEAVAGAVFLDGGWEAAVEFAAFSLREELAHQPSQPPPPVNAKTRLDNWCHMHSVRKPVYGMLDRRAVSAEPMFHAVVRLEGPPKAEAEASASTLHRAENAAAKKLLEKLNVDPRP